MRTSFTYDRGHVRVTDDSIIFVSSICASILPENFNSIADDSDPLYGKETKLFFRKILVKGDTSFAKRKLPAVVVLTLGPEIEKCHKIKNNGSLFLSHRF